MKIKATSTLQGASMLGTEWVALGQGSTLGAIYTQFIQSGTGTIARFDRAVRFGLCTGLRDLARNSNLRLTGKPITDEDWVRLESTGFKVGARSV